MSDRPKEILLTVAILLLFLRYVYWNVVEKEKHITRYIQSHISLQKLESAIMEYTDDISKSPNTLFDLIENSTQKQNWKGPYVKSKTLIDDWGKPFHYRYYPDRAGFQLYTLGKDHMIGGKGKAKDQISEGSLKFINPTK